MPKPRLAWAITGSGHYIEACLEYLLTLRDVDVYLSHAGEEVLKMYGIDLAYIKAVQHVYRDKTASSPPVGHFYNGYYHTFLMPPTTSNTIAKCVLGIADNLITNFYSQADKCRAPCIVYPCDTAPEIETTAPGGKVMMPPRAIDLEGTEKIRRFEYTTVVDNVDELVIAVNQRLASLNG